MLINQAHLLRRVHSLIGGVTGFGKLLAQHGISRNPSLQMGDRRTLRAVRKVHPSDLFQ